MARKIEKVFLIQVPDLIEKNPQEAKEVRGVIDFDIIGDPGSQWSVDLKEKFRVKRGLSTARDTIVTVKEEAFIDLIEGRDSWLIAYGLGKIKVEGSIEPLLRLKNLFSL